MEVLRSIYGDARERHVLGLPANVEGYKGTECYDALKIIHAAIQNHRGFKQFAMAERLPAVDYYVPEPEFIVEFDESQHFTEPREITLRNYPANLKLGFPKDRWISRCVQLHRRDNDPPYRDEQRAWYDTLRDFGSVLRQIPLIRILPEERIWCELSVNTQADVSWFKDFIDSRLHLWSRDSVSPQNGLRIGLVFPELGKHALEHFVPVLKEHIGELDLVIFPEGFEKVQVDDRFQPGRIQGSPAVAATQERYLRVARECATSVLVGMAVDYGDTTLSGAGNDEYCMFVSPTGETRMYHKHSTSRFNAFFDDDWSIADNFPVVEVKGVKVGFSICHDSYISLIPRILRVKGARVWVNISYQNVRPRIWESVLQTRASENGMLAVCTLHRNSDESNPQKEPYAFSERGKIRLKDLQEDKYIDEIPVTRRTGRIFCFDRQTYETLPEQTTEASRLADGADVMAVRWGNTGNLEIENGAGHCIREITVEDFTRSPERIWKAFLEERRKRPEKIPLFIVWVKDGKEWQERSSLVFRVLRGRVIEFSTLFLFMDKEKSIPILVAYRSSNYKDARIFVPAGFPIKADRRYLKGLDSTYKISLGDSRRKEEAVYLKKVNEIVKLLSEAKQGS